VGVFLGVGVETGVVDFASLDLAQDAVGREIEAVELVDASSSCASPAQQVSISSWPPSAAFSWSSATTLTMSVSPASARSWPHRARSAAVMAAGEVLGHQLQRFGVGHHLGEVDALAAERVGDWSRSNRLGDETQATSWRPSAGAGRLLLLEADAQLVEVIRPCETRVSPIGVSCVFPWQKIQRTDFSCCTRASAWRGRSGARRRRRAPS